MNNKNKLIPLLTAALLATAFAGSGMTTVGAALGYSAAVPVWLAAAFASAACALIASGTAGTVFGVILLSAGAGLYGLTHAAGIRAIGDFFAVWQGTQADPARVALGGQTLVTCASLALGALFFAMLRRRGMTALAILILAALLVFSHGMAPGIGIGAAVPGLVAAAAAFALAGRVQKDALALRVLLPSALAVALALLLTPAAHTTWEPMENLANQVRGMVEQYFNFTHERVAFSISEEGYNHGGEIDGQPVAMLGGPANPHDDPVMRVTMDGDLLLRGTIRATYTGYSWIDATPKSRYLYYDLTHRAVRDRVFNLNFDSAAGAFAAVSGEIEFQSAGTSTLFVPGRMSRFDMNLSNAVYYNSSGEMFMAREVAPGDTYGISAMKPVFGEALRQAALWGETEDDGQYAAILASHTQLPAGIDDRLYALTMEITADAAGPYDRAMAIAGYLRQNMRYRLDVEYPPVGRDFASYFVLDYRQGYCSYFATAMAVMGRIAGLPTRYVEGYYARPDENGDALLTGADAHAWAEVYLKGLGWIPFDATNGGPGAGNPADNPEGTEYGAAVGGDAEGGEGGNQAQQTPHEDDSQALQGVEEEPTTPPPAQTPEATPEPEGSLDDPGADDADDVEDSGDSDGDAAPESGRAPWGLMVLPILLLIVLLALWIRSRLKKADPEVLCANTRRAQQSAMIAYRAILTLLNHMGQAPHPPETPEAFATRVSDEFNNPDYADFVRAVTLARYGGKPLKKQDVELGLRAYRRFRQSMRRTERLRFALTRVFRGLGDFEQIP